MIWRNSLAGSIIFLFLAYCCAVLRIFYHFFSFAFTETSCGEIQLGCSQLAFNFQAMLNHSINREEARRTIAGGPSSSGDPTVPYSHSVTLFVQFCLAQLIEQLAAVHMSWKRQPREVVDAPLQDVGWRPGRFDLVSGNLAHSRSVETKWSLRSLSTQIILRFYEYLPGKKLFKEKLIPILSIPTDRLLVFVHVHPWCLN